MPDRRGLDVSNLSVAYPRPHHRAHPAQAVQDVSLHLAPKQMLGLVGESGCGKTSLARALVGLVPSTGTIALDGVRLTARRSPEQARSLQMIFQDPYASLNPRLSVRGTLEEMLRVHRLRPGAQIPQRARELAETVGLPSRLLPARPGALSGGQRQRVAIARALALQPRILVADEPTTALDVSVQAVILDLFARLRDELELSVLLITHNIGIVSAICDRVAVMYLGRIIEEGATNEILTNPRHPYTQRLLATVPRLNTPAPTEQPPLLGDPPSITSTPAGCPFHPRCPLRTEHCTRTRPDPTPDPAHPNGATTSTHLVACHYAWQSSPADAGSGRGAHG